MNSYRGLYTALSKVNLIFAEMAGAISPNLKRNFLKETSLLFEALEDTKTIVFRDIIEIPVLESNSQKEVLGAAINSMLEKIDIQRLGGDQLLNNITQYMRGECYITLKEFKNIPLKEQVLAATAAVNAATGDTQPLADPKKRTIPGEDDEDYEEGYLRRPKIEIKETEEEDQDLEDEAQFIYDPNNSDKEKLELGLTDAPDSEDEDYSPGTAGTDGAYDIEAHPEMTNYHHGEKVSTSINPRRGEFDAKTQAAQMGLKIDTDEDNDDVEESYIVTGEDVNGNVKELEIIAESEAEANLVAASQGLFISDVKKK